VIVEIQAAQQSDQLDLKEFEIIDFASHIVWPHIVNERWKGIETSLQHIEFNGLPVLGEPAKEKGDFIGWVVRPSQ
jgi:hypothetical protein